MDHINEISREAFSCNQHRRCPRCMALSRLTHSLLDTRNGNTVRVYQCIGCGKRIWDEHSQARARLQ